MAFDFYEMDPWTTLVSTQTFATIGKQKQIINFGI